MIARAAGCAVVALALALAPAPLPAQGTGRQLLDRVAAVVGSRVVLLSEIDEEIQIQRAGGATVPEDSAQYAALRRQVLNALVDDEVIYQKARLDTTIIVADAEVQARVEEQFRTVRANFRTEPEWRAQLQVVGFGTSEEYRRWLGDQARRRLYIQRYIGKLRQDGRLRSNAPSDADLRAAYVQALRDPQVQRRPPTISFRQIVIMPRPTAAARAAAEARAESALAQLHAGADFATLARRLSDDAGSKEQGGDLGWFRRGMMVREFDEVAFRLRPGVASPIVRTAYGYHIIQVDRIQPAEIKARHILFSPEVSDTALAAARRLADSVAVLARGAANVDSLVRLYGDTTESSTVGPLDRSRMSPDFGAAFDSARVGQVVVIPVDSTTPTRAKFIVAQVTELQPARDFTFEEARDNIRDGMQQERSIRGLVAALRRQTYIDLRL